MNSWYCKLVKLKLFSQTQRESSGIYAEHTSLELRSNSSIDFNRQKKNFKKWKNDGGGTLGHPPPFGKLRLDILADAPPSSVAATVRKIHYYYS